MFPEVAVSDLFRCTVGPPATLSTMNMCTHAQGPNRDRPVRSKLRGGGITLQGDTRGATYDVALEEQICGTVELKHVSVVDPHSCLSQPGGYYGCLDKT